MRGALSAGRLVLDALPLCQRPRRALGVLAAAKKTTSSNPTFLILIVILVGAYLLFFRPRQQKLRQQQAKQREVEVGDEVVTTSGIIGRVQGFNGDRIEVEIAPGTTIEIVQQGIGRRIEPAGRGAAVRLGRVGEPVDRARHPAAEQEHGHTDGHTDGHAEHPGDGGTAARRARVGPGPGASSPGRARSAGEPPRCNADSSRASSLTLRRLLRDRSASPSGSAGRRSSVWISRRPLGRLQAGAQRDLTPTLQTVVNIMHGSGPMPSASPSRTSLPKATTSSCSSPG